MKVSAILGLAWLFDLMDISIISAVAAALILVWHLNSLQTGLLISSGFIGMILGAVIAGYLGDKYGRKRLFIFTLITYGVGTILCGLAPNYWFLILTRAAAGIGLAGETPTAAAMLNEFIPPSRRGTWLGYMQTLGYAGGPLALLLSIPIIAFAGPSFGWRIIFIVGGVLPLLLLPTRVFLPESPRWLESKGKGELAEKTISSIEEEVYGHALTHVGPSYHPLTSSKSLVITGSPSEILRGPYLRRTIMLWPLWFGLLFAYYGFQTWVPTILMKEGLVLQKSLLESLIIISPIPLSAYVAGKTSDRFGRKHMLLLSLVAAATFGMTYGLAISSSFSIALGVLTSFFISHSIALMFLYTPELYPTRIRGFGTGTASSIGRVGSAFGPAIVGFLWTPFGLTVVFMALVTALLLPCCPIALLGIETKGQVLEGISE